MPKGRIELMSAIPGPGNMARIVRGFCLREGGVVTALSDSALRTLAGSVPDDSRNELVPFGAVARRFAGFCGEYPAPIAHEGHVVAAIGVACADLPIQSPFA